MGSRKLSWDAVIASWSPEKRTSELREPIVYFIARPLALPLVWLAARLGLSPNTLSILSWIVNLSALGLLATGNRVLMAVGPAVALIALVIDCSDGMVARATGRSSKIGEWLDALGAYGLYAWYHLAAAIGAIRALHAGAPVTTAVDSGAEYLLVVAAGVAGTAMLFAIIATAKFAELFPQMGKQAVVARRSSGWYAWLFTVGRNLSFPSGFILPLTSLAVLCARYELLVGAYAVLNLGILGAVLLRCAVMAMAQPNGPSGAS